MSVPVTTQSATAPLRLGRYALIRHLATGGMAEVHLARVEGPLGIEQLVVIKRVIAQLATNQEYLQMFLDEARIASTLQHPNVIQLHDVGSFDGQHYIAMEYLHGRDLRRVLRQAHLDHVAIPIEHAVSVIAGVCAGLHYAHEKCSLDGQHLGIVHRDVSPQNVFVTYDGHVKVVDFGIAKAKNRMTETITGVLKGKLGYMAPEQCCGEDIDRRADLFATAIMLWEMLTGHRLYLSDSEYESMKMIVEADAPSPLTLRPDCPPELEAIVMKGLHRNPKKRYQTAREFQVALETFARENKLVTSSINLSQFMDDLFPGARGRVLDEVEALEVYATSDEDSLSDPRPASTHAGPRTATVSLTDGDHRDRTTASPPSPPTRGNNGALQRTIRQRALLLAAVGLLVAAAAATLVRWSSRPASPTSVRLDSSGATVEGGNVDPASALTERPTAPAGHAATPTGEENTDDVVVDDASADTDTEQAAKKSKPTRRAAKVVATPKVKKAERSPAKANTGAASGGGASGKKNWDPDSPFPP